MVDVETWLQSYSSSFDAYRRAAKHVEERVREALEGRALGIHSISVRAKDPDSLAEKVHQKGYKDSNEVTDLIGVRVITLTEATVESVASRLSSMFRIDAGRSADKTAELGDRAVGYRSKHLILSPMRGGLGEVAEILKGTFVEVQVRSILSHAWAELEHSLRYKFGSALREDLSRRFTLVAGTLELVDREFSSIEEEIQDQIRATADQIRAHGCDELEITTMSLLACLAAIREGAAPLGPAGLKLAYEDAFRMGRLLERVGISTIGQLRAALSDNDVGDVLRGYAELTDSDPDQCSAIVVIASIVAMRDESLFESVRAFQDQHLRTSVLNRACEE